jgi:hypothetical protein
MAGVCKANAENAASDRLFYEPSPLCLSQGSMPLRFRHSSDCGQFTEMDPRHGSETRGSRTGEDDDFF